MGTFVTIRWKNGYRWQTDFTGDIMDYLKKRDIKVRKVADPKNANRTGLKFKITVSSSKAIFTDYGMEWKAYIKAVQIFLTMMGDEAKIITSYGTYLVN